jgi:hypothetical protein
MLCKLLMWIVVQLKPVFILAASLSPLLITLLCPTVSYCYCFCFIRLLAMAQAAGLLKESLTGLTLEQFFDMHCSQALLTSGVNVQQITNEVAKLGVLRQLPAGQRLFSFGDCPDSFFLILKASKTACFDVRCLLV